jgi:predicted nucleic acid-binding protein
MNVFIDTSTLVKKYINEEGTDALFKVLAKAKEIYVCELTYVEALNTFRRKFKNKEIAKVEYEQLVVNFNSDYNCFKVIGWSEQLINESIKMIDKHMLKTLDILQLSSAKISKCQAFLTSDKVLFTASKKEIKQSMFIGS